MLALYSEYSHDLGSYDYILNKLHPALCCSQRESTVERDEVVRCAVLSTPLPWIGHAVAATGADLCVCPLPHRYLTEHYSTSTMVGHPTF